MVVNDILLHKDALPSYAGERPEPVTDKWLKRKAEWKKIVTAEAWDVFWEDNIGQYLVQVLEKE